MDLSITGERHSSEPIAEEHSPHAQHVTQDVPQSADTRLEERPCQNQWEQEPNEEPGTQCSKQQLLQVVSEGRGPIDHTEDLAEQEHKGGGLGDDVITEEQKQKTVGTNEEDQEQGDMGTTEGNEHGDTDTEKRKEEDDDEEDGVVAENEGDANIEDDDEAGEEEDEEEEENNNAEDQIHQQQNLAAQDEVQKDEIEQADIGESEQSERSVFVEEGSMREEPTENQQAQSTGDVIMSQDENYQEEENTERNTSDEITMDIEEEDIRNVESLPGITPSTSTTPCAPEAVVANTKIASAIKEAVVGTSEHGTAEFGSSSTTGFRLSISKLPGLLPHSAASTDSVAFGHQHQSAELCQPIHSPTMPTLELEEGGAKNIIARSNKLPPYLELSADVAATPQEKSMECSPEDCANIELVQGSDNDSLSDSTSEVKNSTSRTDHKNATPLGSEKKSNESHTTSGDIQMKSCKNQTLKASNNPSSSKEQEETEGEDGDQRAKYAKMVETLSSGRYLFQLSEREKTNKLFHLQFNVATNKYIRVSDGDWEIDGWQTAVYESKNMFRKEEHDWKMVYLSRQEGSSPSSTGSVEWRFDFSKDTGLVADHVRIKATSEIFQGGKVSWTLKCAFPGSSAPNINVPIPKEAGECPVDIPNLKGSNAFILRADLRGGCNWQHAQLFRTGLYDYEDQQFEITVHFTNEMYRVEKVLRGKYFNGKLHYLVKWKGYPHSANTWEPESHLNPTLLRYLATNPVRITGKPKKK